MFLKSPSWLITCASFSFPLKESRRKKGNVGRESKVSPLERPVPLSQMKLNYDSNTSSATEAQDTLFDSSYPSPTGSLPEVDTSRQAWTYVFAMFILEVAIWGFASSYGILLDYYLHSKFSNEASSLFILPLVGTVNTGIMAALTPMLALLTNRFPRLKTPLCCFGVVVFVLSIFLSSFSTKSLHVLLTLGVGYAIGGIAIHFPALSYLPSWFEARQGLANGIVFSGNAVGGLIFPIILEFLLKRGGAEKALKYIALILGALCTLALCIIKPRIPPSLQAQKQKEKVSSTLGNIQVFKDWKFWGFLICNTTQALASFLPGLYLPNYAHSMSLGPSSVAIILATLRISGIFGRIIFGTISDFISPHLIGSVSSGVGSISVLCIWGILGAHGLPSLVIFAALFGLTADGWASLYFPIIARAKVDQKTTMTMFGALSITRGIGNIVAAPVSSGLRHAKLATLSATGFGVMSSSYSSLILFCGVGMGGTAVIEALLYLAFQQKQDSTSKAQV
ncbi:hypothetical protein O181_034555 [Austropuccinia psidii MF-1]|uniref:Major facilitator superfamily (MFS) profile domain-containing protein n=1 Tax=Austropuccinia psidii MF-1 TaxID=1389203 RepID=A0A9Q3D574_9BASI|nr:hypothetical protein [Austropuccinia psidii MF-1]